MPPEEFGNYNTTGTIVYLRIFDEDTIKNLLEQAQHHKMKIILSLGNPNPCEYLISDNLIDPNDTCNFSTPHQLGNIDVEAVKESLREFVEHKDIFLPYLGSVIVGIRVFDEPHDRNCSNYSYANHITIDPEDLNQVYSYLKENFPGVYVGSTSPPCYIKRTCGKLCFVQYRWPSSQSLQEFFAPHVEEARANNLFLVTSLNSNYSDVDNQTFFEGIKTLCSMDVDFITSWQWPTTDKYPYPGVEDRIKDPQVANLLIEIKEACNKAPQINSFTADPTSGEAPLTVEFSCQASDPDGSITTYKWDFDGDGNIDETTDTGTVIHSYETAGTYTAKVTVVDDNNTAASSQITITVTNTTNENTNIENQTEISSPENNTTENNISENNTSESNNEENNISSEGGFSCSISPNASFEPTFFLMMLSLTLWFYIYRKRQP